VRPEESHPGGFATANEVLDHGADSLLQVAPKLLLTAPKDCWNVLDVGWQLCAVLRRDDDPLSKPGGIAELVKNVGP
jgi:hypothetical protein